MAKYQVKGSCGHDYEVRLFGSYDDRRKRLEWLATQPCAECRRAAQQPEFSITFEGDAAILVGVRRCFEIKEQLKNRGWRFDGATKTWRFRGDYPALKAELEFILEQGWSLDDDCEKFVEALLAS